MTEAQIQQFASRGLAFLDGLNATFLKYQINTPKRMAAFLGQIAVESGSFRYVKEIWGPTSWQKKYEGHKGLGNTQAGDGKRFMGRGLIQVTGRNNYDTCGKALGVDLIAHPELLEQPLYACLSAGWYWNSRQLNIPADKWDLDTITRKVNGPGMLHKEERVKFSKQALDLLQ